MESQTTIPPLPEFFIGKELTAERINNYAAQKHNLLTQALGRPDTRSVWYSKEHLSQLVAEIGYVDGDGLRIFFGTYEPSHEYAGQTCLVMVITRQDVISGVASHRNIVLADERPDRVIEAMSRAKDFNENGYEPGNPKDFNHGSPCPPLCDFNSGFEYP